MARRLVGQDGFADHLFVERDGVNSVLRDLFAAIDWDAVESLLGDIEPKRRGAPGYPAIVLLRCLFLGELYGLSDPALEAQVSDRMSFRRFAGFSLEDAVPDHSSLWRFREALQKAGLHEAVFEEVNRQLAQQGLFTRKGTILDATIIDAQAARPPRSGPSSGGSADAKSTAEKHPSGEKQNKAPSDPDAAFTRKGGRSFFGYKGHIGMDVGSGLIRSNRFTPANRNDTEPADELIMGDEEAVYADAAYDTHKRRAALKAQGIKPRLMFRPNKHHPILPPRKKLFNKLVSKTRAGVERIFGDMKRLRGWQKVKAYSLKRNTARFSLLCTVLNLKRATVLTR